ncbi:cupin domain-containing protein [Halegenticoccus soli]|uniref:cupin domain-containing protein n=1 Tax=Halegenticoccus soli TaxID=1985678 RepID=UPI000C6D1CD9|nr:cupin domain-containing protein [Halegenticoccus soli]
MEHEYKCLELSRAPTEEAKPGTRWEVSPQLGIDAYNYNVAVLAPGERLSQNAYHYHERQAEFFHVLEGRCRVEVPDDSFDLGRDEVVLFEPNTVHLLHNPFDRPCRLVAVGSPPDGRYPVHQVQSYEELLAERYPDGDRSSPSEEV